MRARSRRHLLHATGLAAAIGLTTACGSSDNRDRYDSESSGYVSGNGVTTEIDPRTVPSPSSSPGPPMTATCSTRSSSAAPSSS